MPKTRENPPRILQPAKKPALVLVHGFRGAPVGLEKIAKTLREDGYDVYIPAIPPFGGAKDLTTYTPDTYADFLADFSRTNKLLKPILIGHSMGSLVVASGLQKHPKVFHQKAILMSPISKRPAAPFRLIAPLSGIAPRQIVDYITTKYLFVPRKDKELFKETLTATTLCSHDHPPLQTQILRAAKFSTAYAITDFHLTQNILLLAGTKDRLIAPKHTLTAAKKLNAETKFLANTGHLHNYEQPSETAKAIIEFLES